MVGSTAAGVLRAEVTDLRSFNPLPVSMTTFDDPSGNRSLLPVGEQPCKCRGSSRLSE